MSLEHVGERGLCMYLNLGQEGWIQYSIDVCIYIYIYLIVNIIMILVLDTYF